MTMAYDSFDILNSKTYQQMRDRVSTLTANQVEVCIRQMNDFHKFHPDYVFVMELLCDAQRSFMAGYGDTAAGGAEIMEAFKRFRKGNPGA